jgi:hypothetical protein
MNAFSMTPFTIYNNHIELKLLRVSVFYVFWKNSRTSLLKGSQSEHNSDCLCPAFITSISTVALVTGFGLLGRRGWCRRFSG